MSKYKKHFAAIAMLMFLSVISIAGFANIATKANNGNLNLLFIQTAPKGALIADKSHPGTFKLVLHNVDSDVTYFSDRPNRVTGIMSAAEFVKVLQQNNPTDSNAQGFNTEVYGIQHQEFHKRAESVVLTLSNPQYDLQHDVMTFTAVPFKSENLTTKLKLVHIKLFFDNMTYCPSCQGPP